MAIMHLLLETVYTYNSEPPVCCLISSIKLLYPRNMHKGNDSTHFMGGGGGVGACSSN